MKQILLVMCLGLMGCVGMRSTVNTRLHTWEVSRMRYRVLWQYQNNMCTTGFYFLDTRYDLLVWVPCGRLRYNDYRNYIFYDQNYWYPSPLINGNPPYPITNTTPAGTSGTITTSSPASTTQNSVDSSPIHRNTGDVNGRNR
jgi:hypothetical protein